MFDKTYAINAHFTYELQYVLALPWEIWGDRFSRQRSTCMYILMNHWIATNMTGSNSLKNRQKSSNV